MLLFVINLIICKPWSLTFFVQYIFRDFSRAIVEYSVESHRIYGHISAQITLYDVLYIITVINYGSVHKDHNVNEMLSNAGVRFAGLL